MNKVYTCVYMFVHFFSSSSSSSFVSQVERFGEPTWRRLVEAVEDEVGGNNHSLAQKIARQHPVSEA